MSLIADSQILLKLLRGMPKSGDHASRLEGFYGDQAAAYDAFRERLLLGRQTLFEQLPLPEKASIVELGGGTGRNAEFLGKRIAQVRRYEVVDLCPSLLDIAQERAKKIPAIHVVEADACHYQPAQKVDCVVCSYSLTMIPDWEAAMRNAQLMLKPEGVLAVVDFTLLPQQPRWLSGFWRRWFGHDGVHLNTAHYQTLQRLFPNGRLQLNQAKVPYLPLIRVPYYLFYSV